LPCYHAGNAEQTADDVVYKNSSTEFNLKLTPLTKIKNQYACMSSAAIKLCHARVIKSMVLAIVAAGVSSEALM
jgi:hypothetical protein